MKRIIDIPHRIYEITKNDTYLNILDCATVQDAIKNSTPLNEVEAEDCISRKAVLGCLYSTLESYHIRRNIMDLPSVYPKNDKPSGEWIHGVCSNCNYDWSKDAPIASVPKYCPNCGADMRESEET